MTYLKCFWHAKESRARWSDSPRLDFIKSTLTGVDSWQPTAPAGTKLVHQGSRLRIAWAWHTQFTKIYTTKVVIVSLMVQMTIELYSVIFLHPQLPMILPSSSKKKYRIKKPRTNLFLTYSYPKLYTRLALSVALYIVVKVCLIERKFTLSSSTYKTCSTISYHWVH